MNKSDLIEIIAEKTSMPRKRAEEAVNMVFDLMSSTLEKGGRIEIRGFGSFVTRDYGAYKGRNPRTGESIKVEPKKLPFFKVGKELKERVDGKAEGSSSSSPKSSMSVSSNLSSH